MHWCINYSDLEKARQSRRTNTPCRCQSNPQRASVAQKHKEHFLCPNFPLCQNPYLQFYPSADITSSPPITHQSSSLQRELVYTGIKEKCLSTLEGLSEKDELELIVDGQDTSTGNTTENVGTSTVEQRLNTVLGDNLAGSIEGVLVLDGLTRGHHHATTDGVKRVGSDTGTSGDTPSESERGKEVVGEGTDKEDRLDGVVQTEVETTVDDDTSDRGHETTVETGNTVRGEGLAVDIDETVELTLTATLGGLGVVGKTGTGIIQRVDEQHRSGTSSL